MARSSFSKGDKVRYYFSSLYDDNIVKASAVLFIVGNTPLFNRLMADRVRDYCMGDQADVDISAYAEFLVSDDDNHENLTFEEYLTYCNTVKVNGYWYSSIDYRLLTAKDKEKLKEHIRHPATHGKLVVYVTDYRDKGDLMRNGTIKNSGTVNLIQLEWPRKDTLETLLANEFTARGVKTPDSRTLQLFIMRLGTSYDHYSETLDRICNGRTSITYEEMNAELKGVASYVMWDLVRSIAKTYTSTNASRIKGRRPHKILKALIPDMGARKVLRYLRRQVNYLVEFRYYINIGVIPIMVPFSLDEVTARLPEKSAIKKFSKENFRRYAKLASETSLEDWLSIQLLLNRPGSDFNELSSIRTLTAIINRGGYTTDRLYNDAGLKDTMRETLFDLNSTLALDREETAGQAAQQSQ